MSIWKYFCEYRRPAHLKTKNINFSQTLKSGCSGVDEGHYFSHRSCTTWTELSRENVSFKNDISFPARDQCALVTRSRPKRHKKGSNRVENLDFWKFLVNVNCLNKFWKSKFHKFLKTLKRGCSDVQRSHEFSRKSCAGSTEFSRKTMFYKIKFFVLGSGKCLYMTEIHKNFHFLEKSHCFSRLWEFCEYWRVFNFAKTADFG